MPRSVVASCSWFVILIVIERIVGAVECGILLQLDTQRFHQPNQHGNDTDENFFSFRYAFTAQERFHLKNVQARRALEGRTAGSIEITPAIRLRPLAVTFCDIENDTGRSPVELITSRQLGGEFGDNGIGERNEPKGVLIDTELLVIEIGSGHVKRLEEHDHDYEHEHDQPTPANTSSP